jgi:hypothetical protein
MNNLKRISNNLDMRKFQLLKNFSSREKIKAGLENFFEKKGNLLLEKIRKGRII